jgi:molybdenum cofactor cytidylyltransferase
MIGAIVLAAGTSSRFGETKQIARWRDKPLAQHAIDAAVEAGLDEIVVVLGHDADRVRSALVFPAKARWVVNPSYASGIAGSLATGLRANDGAIDGAVVLLADQPEVTARHVRMLVEAFVERRAAIVRLRFRDGPGPALLVRDVWPEAIALEGDAGVPVLIERHPELVEEVDAGGEAPPDIDTPEDLTKLPNDRA